MGSSGLISQPDETTRMTIEPAHPFAHRRVLVYPYTIIHRFRTPGVHATEQANTGTGGPRSETSPMSDLAIATDPLQEQAPSQIDQGDQAEQEQDEELNNREKQEQQHNVTEPAYS